MEFLKKSWSWGKWVVAAAVLAWLYLSNREALARVSATPKSWGWLAVGLGLIGGATLVTFVRWRTLVVAQQFVFTWRDTLRLGFIGLVANYVAPGSVGGDIVKAILMAREQGSRKTVAVATVILDRILGLLALVLIGAALTVIPGPVHEHPELRPVAYLMWGSSIAGLSGLGLMLWPRFTQSRLVGLLTRLPKVGSIVRELIAGVGLYQSQPKAVVVSLLLSVVSHSGLIAGFYACALWMQQPWVPDVGTHFSFMPTAELFGAFVPVPAGMGALEGAVQWFYERVRPDTVTLEDARAAGFLAAVAFRVVCLTVAAAGGGFYLTARREINTAMQGNDAAANSISSHPAP